MKSRLFPALVLLLSAATAAAAGLSERPADWAAPVSAAGVENLYKIEDGFYRGAQPTAAGFQQLSGLGVRTVLDLAGGAGDERFAHGGALKLLHVPMSAFGLRDERVLEALRVMADPANRPLMIHCRHGADRTGALVALYRVVVQGWTPEEAVREMNQGGYHHSALWRNLDRYVLEANVAALRKKLNLSGPFARTGSLTGTSGVAPGASAAVLPAGPAVATPDTSPLP